MDSTGQRNTARLGDNSKAYGTSCAWFPSLVLYSLGSAEPRRRNTGFKPLSITMAVLSTG